MFYFDPGTSAGQNLQLELGQVKISAFSQGGSLVSIAKKDPHRIGVPCQPLQMPFSVSPNNDCRIRSQAGRFARTAALQPQVFG